MNKIFFHTFGHFSKKYAVLTSEKVVHYFRAIFPGNFCSQAPNDLCDLYATFRLLFRSNIQISKGSFQLFIFTLPVFLGYRGRVVTVTGSCSNLARKSKPFGCFCYHSGKGFWTIVLIPTGFLPQMDRRTSKDLFCEFKSFN